jgi:nicotinamidase-related amidase
MPVSVLITQCFQRDFIDLVPPHDPLPNRLHVGREEAIRLMGPDPAAGPIAQLMTWAHQQDAAKLHVLHIRDWHDPEDPRQADHLRMFGPHCLKGTPGSELVLGLDGAMRANERTIDAVALNDFEGTDLQRCMSEILAKAGGEPVRVGVVGVWTEAKVTFLLYDLKTRCGIDRLATCSALDASASRAQHFNALEQLKKILGVQVFDSVGDFSEWLVPDGVSARLPPVHTGYVPEIQVGSADGGEIAGPDRDILGFLYRDSSKVELHPLSGGFSGAAVLRVESHDAFGHEQAPSVAKLGPRNLIGAERAAFERVEEILGNNAPSVRGFVDFGDRAGIKYAFAAMGQGRVRTLKSLFDAGAPQEKIDSILGDVFGEILGRLYAAAQYERLPLLEHYGFTAKFAPGVRKTVDALLGRPSGDRIRFSDSFEAENVALFYERFLPEQPLEPGEYHFVSYVHGDLNGANVLVDGRENVWVIDFFHTGRGHVLKDLAKLENDLLYIYTKPGSDAEMEEAWRITSALRRVQDLRAPLAETVEGVTSPAFVRAWRTLRTLRRIGAGLCRSDRDPLQLSIALLRYAVHTTTFDESSPLQKRWALGSACALAEDITSSLRANRRLRVDWIEVRAERAPSDGRGSPEGDRAIEGARGKLGLTLMPGRKDRGRSLPADLDTLKEDGVRRLLCLATEDELQWAGVPDLGSECAKRGIAFRRLPIRDQGTPSFDDARDLVAWIGAALDAGEPVVLHCMGGLGRTGTVAACALIARGMTAAEAIAAVRAARGPRAVEVADQVRFVEAFAKQS